jgi:fatty acid desaturase
LVRKISPVGGVTDDRAGAQSLVVDAPRTVEVEWPTLLVAAGFWSGFVAVLVWHEHLPAALVVVALALLGGWYMSLQHEVIHGHPTPWRWCNRTLVSAPLSLWLPFEHYRVSHLEHHASDLTDPETDPESFYVSPARWSSASRLYRAALRANRTLLGRMTIGPLIGPPVHVAQQLRAAASDRRVRRIWVEHVVLSVATGWIVVGVAGVPLWQYLLGFCFLGMSVTYLRSFAEHLAVPAPAPRSAIVRSNWFFGLLFLNNNLHHTHHTLPGAAWYRLPRLTREIDAATAAASGAGCYAGYREVVRRFGVRPFSTAVHPLARHHASR